MRIRVNSGLRARTFVLSAVVAVGLAWPGMGWAQPRTAHLERTLDFELPSTVKLDAEVGPVRVISVDLSDLGRGYTGGLGSRIRGGGGSELSTTVRARFTIDNPSNDEWRLDVTLEFLDEDGKVIDKVTKSEDYDDETATWNYEHPLLEYVLPLVSKVKVTIDGRLN